MTVTTTITISHEEMERLHLKDKNFEVLGYKLIKNNSFGKIYEKISWSMKGINHDNN